MLCLVPPQGREVERICHPETRSCRAEGGLQWDGVAHGAEQGGLPLMVLSPGSHPKTSGTQSATSSPHLGRGC